MKQINVIVPTRDRVGGFERLKKSWKETTNGLSTLTPVVDIDQVEDYQHLTADINLVVSGAESSVWKINAAARVLIEDINPAAIIGFVSDDFVFRTPDWETEIITWQHVNRGICYCNDLLQGENLPTAVFIHRDIVKALGYMGLPSLKHYYVDNYWLDLGHRLGRIKYFPDIVIEHQHWSNNKTAKDKLYSITENHMDQDKRTWDEFVRNNDGFKEVEKIINYQKHNV